MKTLAELEKTEIEQIKDFLHLTDYKCESVSFEENVKEMCVAKLCYELGIKCGYYYKNTFFEFFSTCMAEVVCLKLNIKRHVAQDNIRLFKYRGVNFIDSCYQILNREDISEAVLDVFTFLDKHKYLLSY